MAKGWDRVLVCGSRDWWDGDFMALVLRGVLKRSSVLIHGAARGADQLAGAWARGQGLEVLEFPADWDRYGRGAGPLRNRQMLAAGKPEIVLAFKDGFDYSYRSGGTEHMVSIAKQAGIQTYVISHG